MRWIRAAVAWADNRNLRAGLPAFVRTPLHRTKKWALTQPLRLTCPASAAQPSRLRVVLFGTPYSDWHAGLTDRAMWQGIAGVVEVLLVDSATRTLPPAVDGRAETVVVPLRGDDIALRPPGFRGLVPDEWAVRIVSDETCFADYMRKAGLAPLCPEPYDASGPVRYPCIVKSVRHHLRAQVCRTAAELAAVTGQADWQANRFVVQEYVPSPVEYTAHCIVVDGRIAWSRGFAFEKEGDIRFADEFRSMAPAPLRPDVAEAIEAILAGLDYRGPCNVDYTFGPDGRLVIFEINPRFGGSLFLPQARQDLQSAFACLIEHAI